MTARASQQCGQLARHFRPLMANNAVELVAATLARHNLHAYTALVAAIEYTED